MKKISQILMVMGISLMMVGCGVTSGEVTGKAYEKAHRTIIPVMQGKVMVPIVRNVPECYRVDIVDVDGNKGNSCVSEDFFNIVKVGDSVNLDA